MSLQKESQEDHSSNPYSDQVSQPDELFPPPDSEQGEAVRIGEESPEAHFPRDFSDSNTSQGPKEAESKKRDHKEGYTAQFEDFKKQFEAQPDLETKLQLAIDFMEASLAQGGSPHFRSFWEARRFCLPLFKENISPAVRSQQWNRYSELSKEARRLKEILDEQSAFAVEQIEIAIQALEKEIDQFSEQVEKAFFAENLVFPQALNDNYQTYENLQKQLNVLNVQASRINALRKELLKTEMRVRQKNKFFQHLSAAGDRVFPKRKELIKGISEQFVGDVDQFIKAHFGQNPSQESLYVLREEIKALQGIAKILTLNTHSFTQTRTRLSECWDLLKVEEKERKKERAHQRVVFKQNADELLQSILTLKEILEKNEGSLAEAQKTIDNIVAKMRKTELGRDELKTLRESLADVRKIMQDKMKTEEEVRQQQEAERGRQKREKYILLKEKAEQLLEQQELLEVDNLITERDALLAEIHDSSITKNEKQELERVLKPLKDSITEKKEKALMALSEDDRQALQQLQAILKQRKERRQEIKNQLEVLRKASGSSSLDFEKAMSFTAQTNEEKERLEKSNQGIQEIERKIVELQSKIKGK